MIKVSVVILNYNGKDYLEKFLPPLIAYTDADIVVADNASSDNSVLFLKENYSNIQLIELEKNFGYADGYNEALKRIDATYFVLLNSDVEVSEGWLEPMIEFLDNNNQYAACQPKILDYNNKSYFEYAGAAGGFLDNLGYPFCRGRIFETLERDTQQYDNETDIFWASGACMTIRSSIFKELRGFDPDFFAHMEEIDLCWRILNSGSKIRSIPKSIIYHVGGGTLSKSSPFKTMLNFRNGIYLLLKNLPIGLLILKLPIRIILDWVAAFKFIFEGSPKHSIAIIKAHLDVLFNFFRVIRKRKATSKQLGSFSILIKYFLNGNKRFSEIQ